MHMTRMKACGIAEVEAKFGMDVTSVAIDPSYDVLWAVSSKLARQAVVRRKAWRSLPSLVQLKFVVERLGKSGVLHRHDLQLRLLWANTADHPETP